jgi:predicted permease
MQYMSTGGIDPRTGRSLTSNFSYPDYQAFRAALQTEAGGAPVELFAFCFLQRASISVESQPTVGAGMLVSGNYFAGMRVPIAAGRGLVERDDRDDAEPAVVVSYAFWQRAFGGDPSAVGRIVTINGSPFTIVGVAGRGYFGVSNGGFFPPADVTVPLHALPAAVPRWRDLSFFTSEKAFWLHLMARVEDDIAEARLQNVLTATFAASPGSASLGIVAPRVVSFPGARGVESMRRTFETPIAVLAWVAGLVFLIACVNVAGLVLARSLGRRREFWIRLALGAGRGRLIRQTLIESVLVAGAGGALGLGLCLWGAPAVVAMVAGPRVTAIDVSLDWGLALTGVAVSFAAALLFGAAPAVRVARTAAAPDFMRQGGIAAQAPRMRAGSALIAVQIAVSVPLVVGAALFLRTIGNLAAVDLGFDPRNLIVFTLDPSLGNHDAERARRLATDVIGRLQSEPGVRGVTLMQEGLIAGLTSSTTMSVEGMEGSEPKSILFNRVGPGFFETVGMPIVAGRGLGLQDRRGTPLAAVLNEAAVRERFGARNPIGRQIRMGAFFTREPIEIVGVARDSKYNTLKGAARPTIFLPYLQGADTRGFVVAVRTDGTREMPRRIRAAVAEVDRDVPVSGLKTQEAQIEESIGSERMFTTLLVFFGGFALLLACVGLHGVTSYAVARRTSEIGVRMALGARRPQVLWLILRQVVALTVAGLAVGLPAAAAASRSIRALLFGVDPADPLSLAAGAAIMFGVAVAAGFAPARRAARLDPLVALRRE